MSSDSFSGQLIFASSCVAFSLYSSLQHHNKIEKQIQEQEQQKLTAAVNHSPIHIHSICDQGDITQHHIQNLSEHFPSENVKNSEKYFHILKSDDYVMGKVV